MPVKWDCSELWTCKYRVFQQLEGRYYQPEFWKVPNEFKNSEKCPMSSMAIWGIADDTQQVCKNKAKPITTTKYNYLACSISLLGCLYTLISLCSSDMTSYVFYWIEKKKDLLKHLNVPYIWTVLLVLFLIGWGS